MIGADTKNSVYLLRLVVGDSHQEDSDDGAHDAEAGDPEGKRHAVVNLVHVRCHTLSPKQRIESMHT